MSLTTICSLESARRKFFIKSTYIMSKKLVSNVFWLRRPKWVYQPSARSNRREENFSSTRRTSCQKSRHQRFFGSGGRNESNNHELVRIGEKKIFHAHDVHLVPKVGIKPLWAQEAEMSLTAKSSLESARKKIFHALDVHLLPKVGIKRLWAQEAEMSLTAKSSLESARRKFFFNSTYIMSKK